MRSSVSRISLYAIMLISLVSCATQNSQETQETETATPIAEGPEGFSNNDIAPSFEEIRRTVRSIVERGPTPNPISRDIEWPPELVSYLQDIRGTRVEGWQGWVDRLWPVEDSGRKDTYYLIIYMEIPPEGERTLGERTFSQVALQSVPGDQVRSLEQWLATNKDVNWHKVSFSGLITGLDLSGNVTLYDASIMPVK